MWFICLYLLSISCSNGVKIFESSLSDTNYKSFYHRTADFGPQSGDYNVSGELKIMQPLKGCSMNDNQEIVKDYTGSIALILRGNCTFNDKVYHAQELGAIGVIIGDYNTSREEWIVMSKDDGNHIEIPAVFVPHNTYQWIYKDTLSFESTSNKIYAMLDSDDEYVANTSTFWLAAFGIVIIVIPTLWCFIVCMALLRKKIINYVQRSRRSKYLTKIPIILYGGNSDECTETENEAQAGTLPIGLSVITQKNNKQGEYTDSYAKLESEQEEEHQNDNNDNDNDNDDNDNDKNENKKEDNDQDNDNDNDDSGVIRNMSRFLLSQFRQKKSFFKPHNDSCAICLDDFKYCEELRLLPCSHGFHIKCIDPWLSKSSELCPMCKQSIFINSENESVSNGCYPSISTICCIKNNNNNNNNSSQINDDDDNDENNDDNDNNNNNNNRSRRGRMRRRIGINSDNDGNIAIINDQDRNNENGVIVLRSSVDSESDSSQHENDQNINDQTII